MNNVTAAKPNFQLGDIYYVIFRHKWKLLLCTLAGLATAGLYYRTSSPPASSIAKLYIRYVTESQGLTSTGEEELRTKTPGARGDVTMASEIAIMTSLNVSKLAAAAIGPEKILREYGGGNDLNNAAAILRSGLSVEVAKNSAVVNIVFTHEDQTIVQPALTEIINQYLKQHLEIHRGTGMMDSFRAKQADEMRARLTQTETELRQAKAKAGVVSPEVTKNYFAETIARLKHEILSTQAFLAEHTAILGQLTKAIPSATVPDSTPLPQISPEIAQSYRDLQIRVEALRRREQELLLQFTPESNKVVDLRASLSTHIKQIQALEADHPQLSALSAPSMDRIDADRKATTLNRIADETSLLAANEAKVKALQKQLEMTTFEALAFDQVDSQITELDRRKQLEEKNYMEFSASLSRARTTEALGTDQISNISQIQTPTPPIRDFTPARKIAAGMGIGGLVLGLGWAILLEFFIDRTIRRPREIEQTLKLPLFLSVPGFAKGKLALPKSSSNVKTLEDKTDANATSEAVVPYEKANPLNPYFETLRDRLIAYFDSINLRHRPKLIAITGLGHESGVSTTAAGLARSLSETKEGNVLLVDMTQGGKGATTPFFQGRAISDLDHLLENKVSIKGEHKLYVATEGSTSEELSRQLPQRFSQLVPKLKTSDFDYIIFDMPPVSQISVTPRLASSMDMVLLVVESEKTDKNAAQRAAALLSKANTNVGVILNKAQTYVPALLAKDHDFFLDT